MGDEPDSPIDTKPRKKSFMDDDDDDISIPKKTSATGEKSKAEKDREAEEAFRKAAEADAQKGNAAPAKKGWGLGGWFGGGKKEAADMSAQPNKPIRAKLGEQSSFYYDPDLKRWINKKGGDTAPTPSATPPPPRAGPPRTASGTPLGAAAPPLRGPPAVRSASESAKGPSPLAQDDGPAASTGDLPSLAPPGPLAMARSASNGSVNGPPSAPPSRPGTGMSNASSIDDLLGPATGGAKRVGAKKKKGRGYIDVMGEKPT
ncbi:putative COPII coat assembly protein SEC16 [Glarea lozoyensis 74030]|nr:putative COPII coat assembly protein SEC16 [Glarea lozoyensis 74030]